MNKYIISRQGTTLNCDHIVNYSCFKNRNDAYVIEAYVSSRRSYWLIVANKESICNALYKDLIRFLSGIPESNLSNVFDFRKRAEAYDVTEIGTECKYAPSTENEDGKKLQAEEGVGTEDAEHEPQGRRESHA